MTEANREVFWSKVALVRLIEICYGLNEKGPRAARKILRLLLGRTEQLADFPNLGRAARAPKERVSRAHREEVPDRVLTACPTLDLWQNGWAMSRKPYPSDLTDEEWELLRPLVPEAPPNPGTEPYDRREIVNAIRYAVRTGV